MGGRARLCSGEAVGKGLGSRRGFQPVEALGDTLVKQPHAAPMGSGEPVRQQLTRPRSLWFGAVLGEELGEVKAVPRSGMCLARIGGAHEPILKTGACLGTSACRLG